MDGCHLSMRARNATTRLTEYTATRVRYKPVTYERVLTLFVPARVFTGARSSSHASPLGPARHSPGDSLFRYRENKQFLFLYFFLLLFFLIQTWILLFYSILKEHLSI